MHNFDGIAKSSYRRGMAIISLICNVERTSIILERVGVACGALERGAARRGGDGVVV